MGFLILPKPNQGGGGSGDGAVKSVNGKTGHVFITANDINAILNLQKTVGGIMVGKMSDIPNSPIENTIFISTDRVPNNIFLYSNAKWERLGGGSTEPTKAISVTFDNTGINTKNTNVQTVLEEAIYKIDLNKNEFEISISELNDRITKIDKSDGKIKITEYDKLDFLGNKLDSTLDVENNILVVKGIKGLFATLTELNFLSGAKDNIQKQIDMMAQIGKLIDTVPTKSDLDNLEVQNLEINDLVAVLVDETKEDKPTLYMVDKDKRFRYVATFNTSLEIRDFLVNPIDLEKEVKGILSEQNIDIKIVRRSELEDLERRLETLIENSTPIESTDDVPEGAENKYYTKTRVDQDVENNPVVKDLSSKSHIHFNKDLIDDLGETEDGILTYKGVPVVVGDGGSVIINSDGRVKMYSTDKLGFLSSKIDNKTIEVEEGLLRAKTLHGMLATIEEVNQLIGAKDNIQKQIDSNSGRIKIDNLDTLGYLGQKIDGSTLVFKDKKLIANRLNGQVVTIGEINFLQGLEGNVQEQINQLNKIGGFERVVKNFSDLANIENAKTGDLVLVSNDETHDNKITFYMYENRNWNFVGEFYVEIRDFTTNPIDLSTETTGVLSEENISQDIMRKTDLTAIIPQSTTDLVEGANLYFTNQRVSDNIDVIENTKARHSHINKEVVDGLSESVEGRLLFNGKEISVEGEVLWGEF